MYFCGRFYLLIMYTKSHLLFTLIFVGLTTLFISCRTQVPPSEIAGAYQDSMKLTVRTRENGEWVFTQAPNNHVFMQFTIAPDGKVEGKVGDAVFTQAECRINRGELGRKLNIKTDYLITGKLSGKIFPESPIDEMDISLPFNMEKGKLHGTLFQHGNHGVYPMAGLGDD